MQWQNFFEFIAENGQGALEKITHNWQVKTIAGIIGAWLADIYQFAGTSLIIFLFLMTMDFFSKMMAIGQQDLKEKNLQGTHFYAIWRGMYIAKSLPMRIKGINKIIQYIFVLTAASLLEKLIPPAFGEYSNFTFDWIIFYLSIGEVKSIFENLREAGMENAVFFVKLFGDKKKQLEDKMSEKKD